MIKHGLYGTRIYRIWQGMKYRCYNPKAYGYKWYGGRSIKVCDEWRNDVVAFWNWAQENGYADNLTIDRIDSNGDYCPENCRWATYKEQANNQSTNRPIAYKGVTKNLNQWIEDLGLNFTMTHDRLRMGWTVEDAFEKPKRKKGDTTWYRGSIHRGFKNGLTHTPTYPVWVRIKRDKSQICESWADDFMNFYNDMGEKPKGYRLIRINPNKPYSKENCNWVPSESVPKYTANKARVEKLRLISRFDSMLKLNLTDFLDQTPNFKQTSSMFKRVGIRIKQLRKEKSLTQIQLCELSKVGKTVIPKIESGHADLVQSSYVAILTALSLT